MSGTGGGHSATAMEARHMERMHSAPMRVECAFCSWWAEGVAGDMLVRQQRHRKRRHGIERISRRKFKNLNSFRQPGLTDKDWQAIEAEVARRKRLHGIAA